MTYTCKRCNCTDTAEDIDQIIKREKLCVNCSKAKYTAICPDCGVTVLTTSPSVKHKQCNDCVDKAYHKRLAKSRVIDKVGYKRAKPAFELICEHCKETFTTCRTTVRFCKKPECVEIGIKIRKLEREAIAISRLQKMASITVYGANVNKMQKYINDKSRKHID